MCGGGGGGEEWILQDLHEQGAIPLIIGNGEREGEGGRGEGEGGRGEGEDTVCTHVFIHFSLQLGLLKDMELAPPTGSHGNPITLEIESDALLILSCLCENNIHRKVKIIILNNVSTDLDLSLLSLPSSLFSSSLPLRSYMVVMMVSQY